MRTTLPALTEREFQRQVMDLAGILGWPDLALVRTPTWNPAHTSAITSACFSARNCAMAGWSRNRRILDSGTPSRRPEIRP